MSAYSPPPQGPGPYGPAPHGSAPHDPMPQGPMPQGSVPYGQPGPVPYGPPAGYGPAAPEAAAGGPLPHGQPPAYGRPPVQQPGVPMFTPTGPERRPWLRPLIAVGVLVGVGAGFWGLSALTDDGKPPVKAARDARVGDCLDNRGTHDDPVLFTIACSDAKADYKIVIDATLQGTCPRELDKYTERGGRQGRTTLCLQPVRH
jgi:hypothetical protein